MVDGIFYEEILIGSIAAAGAASVIITYFLFRDLWSLRYMELVFYVSLNDMLGSIGIALGPAPSGSAACWFQGIFTNFNYLASVFWTTVITYQVNILTAISAGYSYSAQFSLTFSLRNSILSFKRVKSVLDDCRNGFFHDEKALNCTAISLFPVF